MYYRPLLPNGQEVQLPWQIKLFSFIFYWPLKCDATLFQRILDKFCVIFGFLLFLYVFEAECALFLEKVDDIGFGLESLTTAIFTCELALRIYWVALRKQQLKEFIREFYLKIYIEQSSNSKMYRRIQGSLKPSVMHSYFYIGSLMTFFIIPITGFTQNVHLLPFRMKLTFDYAPWPIYIPTLLLSMWVGYAVVVTAVAELYLLVTLVLHLNARFLLLEEDLNRLSADLLISSPDVEHLASIFHDRLVEIINKNLELHNFSKKLEKQYTFQIFAVLSLSATLLCILAFEIVSTDSAKGKAHFIPWAYAKIMDLVVLGRLGSLLSSTTNNISTMYYFSNWEDIILKSTNTKENVRLMKLINLAITVNQKPFHLTGLNFFILSLETTMVVNLKVKAVQYDKNTDHRSEAAS